MAKYLGLDLGTTTISAAVLSENGDVVTKTVPNSYSLDDGDPTHRLQDADAIADAAASLVRTLGEGVSAIGISTQMHGIVYVGADGRALSPLITWQDTRGESVCAEAKSLTGYDLHAGYGAATLLADTRAGKVPAGAAKICSIGDYVAMRLTGRKAPLTHATVAHSFGLYADGFDTAAAEKLGICASLFPEVTDVPSVVGYSDGVSVITALGDNQAAYRGAAETGVLVNFGTGSQVSVLSDVPADAEGIEARPYIYPGKYLLSGSALCGGRAYAALERFFREYSGGEAQYDKLNALAAQSYAAGTALYVDTSFCGTRSDPDKRGSIVGISEESFTPGNLAAGVLCGMVRELYGYFEKTGARADTVTASGNGVRRNPVLARIISDVFGVPVTVSPWLEEAALGAALTAREAALNL